MKKLWKIIKWILIIIALLLITLYVTGNSYIIRGMQLTYLKREKTADIDAVKYNKPHAVTKIEFLNEKPPIIYENETIQDEKNLENN